MRRLLLCLLLAGCHGLPDFGDTAEAALPSLSNDERSAQAEMLIGSWSTGLGDNLCGSSVSFSAIGQARFLLLCVPMVGLVQAQIHDAIYSVSDNLVDLALVASTCPLRKADADGVLEFTVHPQASGDTLWLGDGTVTTVYTRREETGEDGRDSPLTIVNGCFGSGKFVAGPIKPAI